MSKKNEDLSKKTIAELETLVLEMKQKLFALRFQNFNGQLETPSQIPLTRKTIAKILTIINEKYRAETATLIHNQKIEIENSTKAEKLTLKAVAKNQSISQVGMPNAKGDSHE